MTGQVILQGRTAVLATMHGKEQAIAPVLQDSLDIYTKVPTDFDSDQFGTFTRDIPRPGTQLESARKKALAALKMTGGDLGLASEGAFGPHPAMPWVACDRELVLLIDRQHGLELVGEALSASTNYRQTTISSVTEALTFAADVQFPCHGLVVMPRQTPDHRQDIYKGIVGEDQLIATVEQLLQHYSEVWVETDMRAHMNPSRMAVIREATEDLVQKIQQTCPECGWPGFQVTRRLPGLPCAGCGSPTILTYSWVYGCQKCNHQQTVPFPEGATAADPGQCAYCNP
jgi:hypothetical protein